MAWENNIMRWVHPKIVGEDGKTKKNSVCALIVKLDALCSSWKRKIFKSLLFALLKAPASPIWCACGASKKLNRYRLLFTWINFPSFFCLNTLAPLMSPFHRLGDKFRDYKFVEPAIFLFKHRFPLCNHIFPARQTHHTQQMKKKNENNSKIVMHIFYTQVMYAYRARRMIAWPIRSDAKAEANNREQSK